MCSSALEGMQPTFRHVPPMYCFSTIATRPPNCAARMAATYPPGPAPITVTSNRFVSVATETLLYLDLSVAHPRRSAHAVRTPYNYSAPLPSTSRRFTPGERMLDFTSTRSYTP